jgi:hypothetical protein
MGRKGVSSSIQGTGGETMEKIVNELRVIETDDGFRIEIKGDKEKIRAFMAGAGKQRRWPHWGAGPRGPFPFGPWMSRGAWCHGPWDFEAEEGHREESSQA